MPNKKKYPPRPKPKTEADMERELERIRFERMSRKERVYWSDYERVLVEVKKVLGADAKYLGMTSHIRPRLAGVSLANYLKVSHGAIWYGTLQGRTVWVWQP